MSKLKVWNSGSCWIMVWLSPVFLEWVFNQAWAADRSHRNPKYRSQNNWCDLNFSHPARWSRTLLLGRSIKIGPVFSLLPYAPFATWLQVYVRTRAPISCKLHHATLLTYNGEQLVSYVQCIQKGWRHLQGVMHWKHRKHYRSTMPM